MINWEYEDEEKGKLPFLVWWQSLDGRLNIEYFDSLDGAFEKYRYLEALGRKPQVWRKLEIE